MPSSIAEILKLEIGSKCLTEGWVRTRRDSKDFSFFSLNDGSNLKGLQVVIDADVLNKTPDSDKIRNGAAVTIEGELVESPGNEQSSELKAEKIKLHGSADLETYPLQKKRHSNEFLRTIPHLRSRTNTFGAIFRLRSELSFAVHSFFKEKGFYYIHTPIITTSDCEGAGRLFQATTLFEDLEKDLKPKEGEKDQNLKVNFKKDFFKKPAYLTVSGQLEAEALACSHKNVYTFGPTFRAENSNTARHAAEFWMVEPEIAFASLQENMQLAEDFIKYLVSYALEKCTEDMEFFNKWVEKGIIDSLKQLTESEFIRMPYTEAIKILKKAKVKFEYPVEWGEDLQTEHERYLSEEYIKGPVFITNYPKTIKPFYMFEDEPSELNDFKETVSAMDLLVPRLGEIIGGSQREHRAEKLKAKLQHEGMLEEMSWYQELRDYGTVPHAGFGLGFERLLMYVSGLKNIRDVIAFPRTAG